MKRLILPAVVLTVLVAAALPAGATYPGTNGAITYSKNLEPGPEIGLHEIFKLDGGVELQVRGLGPPDRKDLAIQGDLAHQDRRPASRGQRGEVRDHDGGLGRDRKSTRLNSSH